jgi:DNA-binding CsgD family transcriptional regulator
MATVRNRHLSSVATLVQRGLDSRTPAPELSTLSLEIDGHVYVLVPETVDEYPPGDHNRRRACGDAVRAGELITPKGRYVIVQADAARADDERASRRIHCLSRRELQVVVLVAEGCVNKQIADQLKISEWTVSTHLRRIFAKLSVDSRAAMVYRCLSLLGRKGPA